MKTKNKKVLVFGASGLIGSWVYKTFKENYPTTGIDINPAKDLIQLNIGDYSQLERFVDSQQPGLVINCVGLVGKQRCTTHKEQGEIANLTGVKNLSYFCKKQKIKLIHFSTIVVHDGKKSTPYLEEDSPSERSDDPYNKQKSQAESIVQSVPDSAMIRLGDIYGYNAGNSTHLGGDSFKFAYDSLKQGKEFQVFQVKSNKTLISDLGNVVIELYKQDYKGIINIGGEVIDNTFFIKKVKSVFNLPGKIFSQTPPENYPIHKLLDTYKMKQLGIKLHSIDEGLEILSPYLKIK